MAVAGASVIEFTFPSDSWSAGEYIYVATESTGFNAYFGFDPDYLDSVLSINGNDVVEIFRNGLVVDQFGEAMLRLDASCSVGYGMIRESLY